MSRKSYAELSKRSTRTYLKSLFTKPDENDRQEVRLDNDRTDEIEMRNQVTEGIFSCSFHHNNVHFKNAHNGTEEVDHTLENRSESENQLNSRENYENVDESREVEDIGDRIEDVDMESNEEENNGVQEEVADVGDRIEDVQIESNKESGGENESEIQYNLEENYEDKDESREVENVRDRIEDIDMERNEEGEEEQDENAEEESEEDIGDNDPDENDPPLYTNAPLKVSESMLLMLTVARNHNITQVCLADLLTVINLHCPDDNLQRHSLYKFNNFFSLTNDCLANNEKHYYCELCLRYLNSAQDICYQCQRDRRLKAAYFIEMSIIDQLQILFERQGFYDKLQHRFNRSHVQRNTINDVYDGSLYQRWYNNGFLANPSNISFIWYTDGVPVFQSSKISMWPIYLTINELPFNERTKKENLLLAALWFGSKKPDGNHFFYKLYDQFKKLFDGYNFYSADSQIINVKSVLLMGTCDIVARVQFLNFTQHNGQFGCTVCTSPGETFNLQSGGTTHVYRYEEQLTLRTSQQSIEYGDMALQWGIPVMGVKGPSILSKLMPDFITGTCIDQMHCIDSGVVKKLLSLWFDQEYSSFPFSLYNVLHVVNERLIAIKPPKFAHRMPLSVKELTHWKASECKMWFFYYSAPVLHGIMRNDYFQHYLLLIIGVSFLSADGITSRMLELSENCLEKFTREFEVLYGLQFCSINIHQILHLPKCVQDLGPLWVYSCYFHEDLNGRFLNYIHGTRHIDSQIASSHIRLLNMQWHLERLTAGPIKNFCSGGRYQVKICEEIFENCFSVGVYTLVDKEQLADPIRQSIEHLLPLITHIQTYLRLLKDKKLYVSECYTRSLQTQSSHVLFKTEEGLLTFASIYCLSIYYHVHVEKTVLAALRIMQLFAK